MQLLGFLLNVLVLTLYVMCMCHQLPRWGSSNAMVNTTRRVVIWVCICTILNHISKAGICGATSSTLRSFNITEVVDRVSYFLALIAIFYWGMAYQFHLALAERAIINPSFDGSMKYRITNLRYFLRAALATAVTYGCLLACRVVFNRDIVAAGHDAAIISFGLWTEFQRWRAALPIYHALFSVVDVVGSKHRRYHFLAKNIGLSAIVLICLTYTLVVMIGRFADVDTPFFATAVECVPPRLFDYLLLCAALVLCGSHTPNLMKKWSQNSTMPLKKKKRKRRNKNMMIVGSAQAAPPTARPVLQESSAITDTHSMIIPATRSQCPTSDDSGQTPDHDQQRLSTLRLSHQLR